MALYFSRRSYNAQTRKFTNNAASVTRYVQMTSSTSGGIISQADWLQQVRQAGGTREVLIYVHGFNTSQSDMLDRLGKIENGLQANGFRGAVVAYDWPSDGVLDAYDRDRTDAKRVAPHLVGDGMLPLLGMSPRPKVHILAHSMGALVVLRAFSDFGDSAGGGWAADQVMFASGDVDSAWLEKGAWGGLVLDRRAARFTNYYSGRDRVLSIPGELFNKGRPRAGQAGMPPLVTDGHWDIYCNEQYVRDVPSSDQTLTYSHRWWFDNDGFYKDVALTVAGRDATTMPTRRRTNISDLALLS